MGCCTQKTGAAGEPAVSTYRVPVPDEDLVPWSDVDYADAFEARVGSADDRAAEEWARAALDEAPSWMRAVIVLAHRRVLRFRPATAPSSGHVLGMRITVSEPDVVRLDTDGPVLRATLVARRTGPTTARVVTYLWFRHPAAPWLWRLVGPCHRTFVPRLLRHAALANPATASARGPLPR